MQFSGLRTNGETTFDTKNEADLAAGPDQFLFSAAHPKPNERTMPSLEHDLRAELHYARR
jgi:hypothetical protein